jgi:hypothetical protein
MRSAGADDSVILVVVAARPIRRSLKRRRSVDAIGLPSSGVIFAFRLSVAILLARGYRGSFVAKGARNRERSEPVPP